MKHDDLDPIVEKIRTIDSNMRETAARMERRDEKHHTGSAAWLLKFNFSMRA
jgi:hypothetical protein